jgi:hypothetical protein
MNSNSFRLTAKVMLILMPATPLAEATGLGFVSGTILRQWRSNDLFDEPPR